jgi:hypothetical protein
LPSRPPQESLVRLYRHECVNASELKARFSIRVILDDGCCFDVSSIYGFAARLLVEPSRCACRKLFDPRTVSGVSRIGSNRGAAAPDFVAYSQLIWCSCRGTAHFDLRAVRSASRFSRRYRTAFPMNQLFEAGRPQANIKAHDFDGGFFKCFLMRSLRSFCLQFFPG